MYLYVMCVKKPTIFFIHEWKKTYADELIFSSWVKKYANQILVSQFQYRFPYFFSCFKNSWKKSQLLSFWLLYKIVDFYMKAIFWSKYNYKFYFYFWRIVFQFLIVNEPYGNSKSDPSISMQMIELYDKTFVWLFKVHHLKQARFLLLRRWFFFLGRKFSIFSQICVVCVFRVWLGPNSPVLFKTFLFFISIQWKLVKL